MSKDKDPKNKVGYGNPPKHTQFGQDGGNPINRGGRPKGSKNYAMSDEYVRRTLLSYGFKPIATKQQGETVYMSSYDALIAQAYNMALKGDMRAIKLILDETRKASEKEATFRHGAHIAFLDLRDEVERTAADPKSLEHYLAQLAWFKYKQDSRSLGIEYIYEDGEPVTKEDWIVFHYFVNKAKSGEFQNLPWPIPTPSYTDDQYSHAIMKKAVGKGTKRQVIEAQDERFNSFAEWRRLGICPNLPYDQDEPRNEKELEQYNMAVDAYYEADGKKEFEHPFAHRIKPINDDDNEAQKKKDK